MQNLSTEESWKMLSKEEDYRNERFSILKERFVTPRKTEGVYYVLEANSGVKIIALDHDDIIMIEEYRYPIGKRILEIPGGGIDNDLPEEAAKRELLEEVGVIAKELEVCGSMNVLPGLIRSTCHVFLAKNLTFAERILDDTEADSIVVRINKYEVYRMLDNGEIENPLSAAALLKARKFMDL